MNSLIPVTVIWRKQDQFYRTYNSQGELEQVELFHGILRPGETSLPQEIWIQNSSAIRGTNEVFRNVRLYLDAPDNLFSKYLESWVNQAAGIEISFDNGANWQLFTLYRGNPESPASWITIPAVAIGSNAEEGTLHPNDVTVVWLRVRVPGTESQAGVYPFGLGIDLEVE